MLSVARHRVAVGRPAVEQQRFEWFAADAAAMPLGDASVDAVTSSFMLQLVDDRPAVLREVLRVLRPGGAFSMVTWLAEELLMPADDAFEEALEELRIDGPDDGFRPPRITDFASVEEARDELSEAGFATIDVRLDELHFAWTRAQYLKFKQCYDDRELFASLSADDRERLVEAVGIALGGAPGAGLRHPWTPGRGYGAQATGVGPGQAAKGVASRGLQTRQGR